VAVTSYGVGSPLMTETVLKIHYDSLDIFLWKLSKMEDDHEGHVPPSHGSGLRDVNSSHVLLGEEGVHHDGSI